MVGKLQFLQGRPPADGFTFICSGTNFQYELEKIILGEREWVEGEYCEGNR